MNREHAIEPEQRGRGDRKYPARFHSGIRQMDEFR